MLTISEDNLQLASQQLWDVVKQNTTYLSATEIDLLQLAFDFMVEKHNDQRRQSGEYYIIHPVSSMLILADLKLEVNILIACLLHDVPEDTYANPNEGITAVTKEFGPEVGFLVAGITKLSVIKYRGEKRYIENLRKLFIAMSKDLRIIFIKLADRIHNLQTLKYLPENKAKRIALESLEIYAPIAERLGISHFRTTIEELAFKYAYPEENANLLYLPHLNNQKRQKILTKLITKTKFILKNKNVEYKKVLGRTKSFYSIYKKMIIDKKSITEILDLIALRIVANSISDCYKIMSILHEEFEVIEGKTKDYIQNPKNNGYKSLHLTVKEPKNGLIFEYQIRTQKMHDFAEYGVAAHYWYKEYVSNKKKEDFLDRQSLKWVNQLVELGNQKLNESEYLKHVKLNVFPDRIFVFTPKGDVIDLPKGATCLDFAFKIHEYIGSHAQIAKINSKVVKLNDELKNGDVVEIIVSKNQKPTRDWLNWSKTNSANKKIRSFLRQINLFKR